MHDTSGIWLRGQLKSAPYTVRRIVRLKSISLLLYEYKPPNNTQIYPQALSLDYLFSALTKDTSPSAIRTVAVPQIAAHSTGQCATVCDIFIVKQLLSKTSTAFTLKTKKGAERDKQKLSTRHSEFYPTEPNRRIYLTYCMMVFCVTMAPFRQISDY